MWKKNYSRKNLEIFYEFKWCLANSFTLENERKYFLQRKDIEFHIFFLIFVFNYSLEMLLNIIFKSNRQ